MPSFGILRSCWVAFGFVLLAACAQPPQTPALVVTGSATYRERIALPPQAVFEASVEDVSRADAPSTTLGRVRIESPRVPLSFSIPVDAAQLHAAGRYVLRARIVLDGRPVFTSDTAHEVLGTNGVRHADILLRRVDAAPAAASRRLTGRYSLMADAALFIDCTSGERLAVAEEGDNAALQRAYLAARPSPGASMRVTVDGRVESRPPVEGAGAARPTLVVERHLAVDTAACDAPLGTAKLEDTYWKLVRLQGRPVDAVERQREPHLVLQSAQRRVAGSAGCNRILGSYSVDGDRISFGRAAGTMMACPQGMEQEQTFLDVLAAAARWRIDVEQLELLDAQGLPLARFESVYLR